jgi:eukaryotic-like serine/threonine-protein kinase
MYEALTGRTPFDRDLPWIELVRSICGRPVRPARELNPAIPEELDVILTRALDKTVERRFATASEFRAALEAVRI